jgi:HK97 family phage major capsid protein
MLESLIDTQLLYGLAFEEDRQLLLGDGSGQNIHGILPQATAFVATGIPAGATSFVDRLRWAKLQARKALLPADGIVLNPEDWAKIEMLKDAEGRYLYSAFTSGAEQRLWGMRVVESDAITAGQFLIGSFTSGAQIWDREDASVEVSYENSDNFVRNALTIRAEERLALTVYRPNAFVTGALAAA